MDKNTTIGNACDWSHGFICKMGSLLGDQNQWITWFLVVIGWGAAGIYTIFELRKNKQDKSKENHNEWIGEFREKLEALEDFALEFWAENSSKEQTIALAKIQRDIKSLTTSAKEIEKSGGVNYPTKHFKDLRQAMTNDDDIDNRPLSPTCYQVRRIRETCVSLRSIYSRKN